ncbi:MAG: glycosyltransferase, partial [Nitrosopumilaceae archaeon]
MEDSTEEFIVKQHTDLKKKNSQPTVIYLHRSPDLNPRTLKIKYSLERNGFKFIIFRPKFTVNLKSRLLSSLINYFAFFLQSLFVRGDILWVSNCPDTVGLGPWFANTAYVYDYRSPWSKEVEIEFGKGILSKVAGIIERRIRSKALAIVVVSSQMVKDVEHLGKKVFVVPNYPLESFLPSKTKESIRSLTGCNQHSKVVVFVGKLSRVEGADMLEKIAEGLSSLTDVKLWIVGDGPLKAQMEELAHKYPSTVTFFGWVDYRDVPNYIAASDVCIVPRHKNQFSEYYNEQGVTKIAEYIAMGKPVVACNIAQSTNYILQSEESFIDGIKTALDGRNQIGKKRF